MPYAHDQRLAPVPGAQMQHAPKVQVQGTPPDVRDSHRQDSSTPHVPFPPVPPARICASCPSAPRRPSQSRWTPTWRLQRVLEPQPPASTFYLGGMTFGVKYRFQSSSSYHGDRAVRSCRLLRDAARSS